MLQKTKKTLKNGPFFGDKIINVHVLIILSQN